MKVRFRTADSIADDLDAVQRRIAARAADVFREGGATIGRALEDWVKAERDTVWKPALEVRRTKDAFVIQVAIAGVDPAALDVKVTLTELLITADLRHAHHEGEGEILLCEFASGPLFRSYRFPEPVDPDRVAAECRDGLLRVTAPLAQQARSVDIKTAP